MSGRLHEHVLQLHVRTDYSGIIVNSTNALRWFHTHLVETSYRPQDSAEERESVCVCGWGGKKIQGVMKKDRKRGGGVKERG